MVGEHDPLSFDKGPEYIILTDDRTVMEFEGKTYRGKSPMYVRNQIREDNPGITDEKLFGIPERYMTSKGRIVSSYEAAQIAFNRGQVGILRQDLEPEYLREPEK